METILLNTDYRRNEWTRNQSRER